MITVIGVRFKKAGRIYYFDPGHLNISPDTNVIVETIRGVEFGTVVYTNKQVDESEVVTPLKSVIRMATESDKKHYEENIKKEKEAFDICFKKIKEHGLDMKLIDTEYTFDNNKVLFYFTSDGRVDFRELVKDLASIFKTRIELRQIGVRDESKMMGGVGVCGRVLCCKSFLSDFDPVSIKMAKEQGLSLNPAKISGLCGRLMCCLKYEQDAYETLLKKAPKEGALVKTPDGQGIVVMLSLLKEQVTVKLDMDNDTDLKTYMLNEIKLIKDADKYEEPEVDIEELKKLEE
jgi:cell fate regulator YaaT (PSP1 superfamily)